MPPHPLRILPFEDAPSQFVPGQERDDVVGVGPHDEDVRRCLDRDVMEPSIANDLRDASFVRERERSGGRVWDCASGARCAAWVPVWSDLFVPKRTGGGSTFSVQPLTERNFKDLEDLFGQPGGSIVRGCWCMHYRRTGSSSTGKARRARPTNVSSSPSHHPTGHRGLSAISMESRWDGSVSDRGRTTSGSNDLRS